MRRARFIAVAVAGAASVALVASAIVPVTAAPIERTASGQKALTVVLDVADFALDPNWNDFDIFAGMVSTYLQNRPNGSARVLADGKTALTCFVPTDRAFKTFASNLKGKLIKNERNVFTYLLDFAQVTADNASIISGGRYTAVDVLETMVLSHCTTGTMSSEMLHTSARKRLPMTMLSGAVLTPRIVYGKVTLYDAGTKFYNPRRTPQPTINAGNRQVAFAISDLIVPVDLTPKGGEGCVTQPSCRS